MFAKDLPSNISGTETEQLQKITQSFYDSGKQLYSTNIDMVEANELNLFVERFWSPDTLSLCLPSYVPKLHQRFKDYGGIVREDPHPYP